MGEKEKIILDGLESKGIEADDVSLEGHSTSSVVEPETINPSKERVPVEGEKTNRLP